MSGIVSDAARMSIFRRSSPGAALCQSIVTFGFALANSSAPPLMVSLAGVPRLKTFIVTGWPEAAGLAAGAAVAAAAGVVAAAAGAVVGAVVGVAGGAWQAASSAPPATEVAARSAERRTKRRD